MAAPRPKQALAALLGLLALGCAAAGCGSGGETTASAGTPPAGRYAGETSQGLPISFIVTGATVREVSFGWRATCDDGQVHTNTIALPGGGIHLQNFSSGGRLETGGIAHVEGNFDGAQASGELSRARGSAFGANCRAVGIDWSANLVAGAPPDGAAPGTAPSDVPS